MEHNNKRRFPWGSVLFTLAAFAAAVGIFLFGVGRAGSGAEGQWLQSTRQAIRRAAVSCYAIEGIYPPDLHYLQGAQRRALRIQERVAFQARAIHIAFQQAALPAPGKAHFKQGLRRLAGFPIRIIVSGHGLIPGGGKAFIRQGSLVPRPTFQQLRRRFGIYHGPVAVRRAERRKVGAQKQAHDHHAAHGEHAQRHNYFDQGRPRPLG